MQLTKANLTQDGLIVAHDAARVEFKTHPPGSFFSDLAGALPHLLHPLRAFRGQGGDFKFQISSRRGRRQKAYHQTYHQHEFKHFGLNDPFLF